MAFFCGFYGGRGGSIVYARGWGFGGGCAYVEGVAL